MAPPAMPSMGVVDYLYKRDIKQGYLIRLSLTPGMHSLKTSWIMVDDGDTQKFSCQAGEQKFIQISSTGERKRTLFSRYGYKLKNFSKNITIGNELPDNYDHYNVLVYSNWQWVDLRLLH